MTDDKQSFVDKLKTKAEELHLKEKVEGLADQADKLTRQAAGKVGDVTHDNRAKVEDLLDKAAAKVDETTGGKYSDKIAKARKSASHGVDFVEGQGTQGAAGDTAESAADTVADAADTAADAATDAADTAADAAESAADTVADAAESAADTVTDAADTAADAAESAADDAK